MDFVLLTTEEIALEICQRLKAARIQLDFTKSELALRSGLSLETIKKFESQGRCTLQTLLQVARALGLLSQFNDLFINKKISIAEMERATKGRKRVRHPTSRSRR